MVCFCTLLFAAEPGIWIDVPFVKQTREGCGAASLAMVMQYWLAQAGKQPGESSDAAFILQQLHSREGRGIYASDMERYLKQNGFRTFAFSGTWDDLKQHLQQGRPLVVALKPIDDSRALHYVVVAGLDSEHDLVLFNDPAGRKQSKLDRKSFENQWNATKHWTLLAVPQEER